MPNIELPRHTRRLIEPLAAVAVIVMLVSGGVLTCLDIRKLWMESRDVARIHQMFYEIAELESAISDAERSQRGYMLTGDVLMLEPMRDADTRSESALQAITELTGDRPHQLKLVQSLRVAAAEKLETSRRGIELRRVGNTDAAAVQDLTSQGRAEMASFIGQLKGMRAIQAELYDSRLRIAEATHHGALLRTALISIAGLGLLGMVLHLNYRRRARAERDAATIFQEREKLRVTLSSIGDAVISCNREGSITFMNPIAESLTGWPMEEAKGKSLDSVFRIVNEHSRTPVKNSALRALNEGVIVGLANRTTLITRQNLEIPIDDSAAPIHNAQGDITGVVLAFHDVTQRREEERRLNQTMTFMRRVLDALSESIIVLDAYGRVLNSNLAFRKAFQLSENEINGVHLLEVAQGILSSEPIISLVERVTSKTDASHSLEVEHEFTDAGQRILKLTASHFHYGDNHPHCVLLVIADITEGRQLEKHNRRLDLQMRWFLERIQDYAIFMIDTDYRATSWNLGVEQVLGFSEEEFIGQDVRPLIFLPDAIADGTAQSEFDTAARTGHASDDRWMLRKGGRHFWASGITTAVRDEQGNLVGYSKVMRDLTLRKKAQDDLAELAAKLSEESRRKNEFLATLAHELRNPLAPIKNAVQLMGMSPLPTDVEELRETMARQVEQLVRLIDDLLDVSRISRGKIVLRKEVVELHSIIDAAVEASKSFIDENGQDLSVHIADHGLTVEADPTRLTQVISNLLNNSAKYSDAGCKIELTAHVEGRSAVIRVRDNGIGIATERLDDIFQMFSQVNNSLERGTAGLGIGLTLVKTLVELHGGIVTADSEGIGKGSTFTVRLPITDKPPDFSDDTSQANDQISTRSFRVLVVEDMRALSMVMARLLQKIGHEVQVVDNAPAALDKLKRWTPDVIFSDISMPGMTGYELANRLRHRADTKHLYMVAMTGYGQSTDRDKAIQSGFDKHLVKPVDIVQLQAVFSELAHRKSP